MYDAVIGRFFNEDPIGLDGGDFNRYRYVCNNPVNLSDPEGLGPPRNEILEENTGPLQVFSAFYSANNALTQLYKEVAGRGGPEFFNLAFGDCGFSLELDPRLTGTHINTATKTVHVGTNRSAIDTATSIFYSAVTITRKLCRNARARALHFDVTPRGQLAKIRFFRELRGSGLN